MANELQTLFGALFAIFFATTVSASGTFSPFDSSAVMAGDRRALKRFVIALLVLDVVPFFYFLAIWGCLSRALNRPLGDATLQAFGVLFAALAYFGFYRVFGALAYIRRNGPSSPYYFYSDESEIERFNYSPAAEPPGKRRASHVLFGSVIWLALCLVLFAVLLWIGS
jgi:hypothetical protein